MKLVLSCAIAGALAAAGIALASGNDARTITKVSGTFTATTLWGRSSTSTCTTSNGRQLTTTRATYTGTAAGPADLTGPVQITTSSTIDTAGAVGTMNGRLTISPSGGGRTDLQLSGVYDGGTVVGLVTGHSATRSVQLLGNVSAGYSPTGGFTNGRIGGSAGGSALELAPTRCGPVKQPPRERSTAEGAVSAVSATSITVAGLTCAVPSTLAAQVAAFKVGDQVRIECTTVSGTSTLTGIGKRK